MMGQIHGAPGALIPAAGAASAGDSCCGRGRQDAAPEPFPLLTCREFAEQAKAGLDRMVHNWEAGAHQDPSSRPESLPAWEWLEHFAVCYCEI